MYTEFTRASKRVFEHHSLKACMNQLVAKLEGDPEVHFNFVIILALRLVLLKAKPTLLRTSLEVLLPYVCTSSMEKKSVPTYLG